MIRIADHPLATIGHGDARKDLAVAYLRAVEAGDKHALMIGVRLAQAELDAAPAVDVDAKRSAG